MSWAAEDHTADALLRVEGASWVELVAEAARCFGEYVGGEQRPDAQRVEREIEVAGVDAPETWVRYWRALHRLWSVERLLPLSARVDRDATLRALRARVSCAPAADLDAEAFEDVKAVTWHGAEAAETDGRWRGRIVLDL